MELVKKIPVIGYLVRLLVAIAKLPKHLDRLYEMEAKEETLRVKQEELVQKQEELIQWNRDRMDEIKRVGDMIGDLQQFRVGEDYIKKLNRVTSLYPTIWGDEEKLHLSKLSSVSNCMFNTNSGHITVGDYTFSGSGVSILAGSHDMKLSGLLRRDAELTEGCDIVIGDGVWLASNCTILGPATIGDHAVVAAGAVVTPGTNIPAYAIYGGVPAKQLGEIDVVKSGETDSPVIRKALRRNKGVLFAEGWSETKEIVHDEKVYRGHFQSGNRSKVYIEGDEFNCLCLLKCGDRCLLKITIDGRDERVIQFSESSGKINVVFANREIDDCDEIHVIEIVNETEATELFFAV